VWCRLEHGLICRPLFGNLREKFLLRDDALFDQQLCQRVGLGKAGHEKLSTVTGAWFDEFAIQVLLMISAPTGHVLPLGLPPPIAETLPFARTDSV
jgi:hypothetical protein